MHARPKRIGEIMASANLAFAIFHEPCEEVNRARV